MCNTSTSISGALEKGLGSGLQSGSEATRMWMAYLVFQRRLIKWDQEHAAELDALRESGQQAITMIDSCKLNLLVKDGKLVIIIDK